MHIGMVGLGRMGGNMRDRIEAAGHTVTGYDANPEISDVASLADLVAAMPAGEGLPVVDRSTVTVRMPRRSMQPLMKRSSRPLVSNVPAT